MLDSPASARPLLELRRKQLANSLTLPVTIQCGNHVPAAAVDAASTQADTRTQRVAVLGSVTLDDLAPAGVGGILIDGANAGTAPAACQAPLDRFVQEFLDPICPLGGFDAGLAVVAPDRGDLIGKQPIGVSSADVDVTLGE